MLHELKAISPEIATYIERYYAELPDSTPLLDVLSPHAMAHRIAETHPDLGAAFYRLVEQAARECFDARIGWMPSVPAEMPRVSPALGGLINSKDSSWF